MGLLVLAVIGVFLTLLAYLTRRRFGVLGLALAAGAYLSSAWSDELIGIVNDWGVSVGTISLASMVAIGLTLAPAVVLLFSGPVYASGHGRRLGALLFGLFATALVAESISGMVVLDSAAQNIFVTIATYEAYIVTVGVALAVIDVLGIHMTGGGVKPAKH